MRSAGSRSGRRPAGPRLVLNTLGAAPLLLPAPARRPEPGTCGAQRGRALALLEGGGQVWRILR